MQLKNHEIVSAAGGVALLASLQLTKEDGKSLDFPFTVQYRLGRLGDCLNRAARIIERTKFRRAMDAAPANLGIAAHAGVAVKMDDLDQVQRGMIEDAALAYLEEDTELTDEWVKPIKLSELGVPLDRLTHGARWVRDLGPLLVCDVELEPAKK